MPRCAANPRTPSSTSRSSTLVASTLVSMLALPAPALAGGLGPYLTGGFHTEPVYYYSRFVDGDANGTPIRDPDAYEQYKDVQIIGNAGAGLELVLGDRDDMIQGVFRGFWQMDTPQLDPSRRALIDDDALVVAFRDTLRHTGVGTVGMQFGVARAAQQKFKVSLAVHLGAGFVSGDNTLYLLAQAGTNLSYLINRTVEVYVDVNYALRVRKTLSNGMMGGLGLRVMFD